MIIVIKMIVSYTNHDDHRHDEIHHHTRMMVIIALYINHDDMTIIAMISFLKMLLIIVASYMHWLYTMRLKFCSGWTDGQDNSRSRIVDLWLSCLMEKSQNN